MILLSFIRRFCFFKMSRLALLCLLLPALVACAPAEPEATAVAGLPQTETETAATDPTATATLLPATTGPTAAPTQAATAAAPAIPLTPLEPVVSAPMIRFLAT